MRFWERIHEYEKFNMNKCPHKTAYQQDDLK